MKTVYRSLTGFITFLLLVNLLGDPAVTASAAAMAAPPPPGLFSDAPPDKAPTPLDHPAARRSRRARLNLEQIPGQARGLTPQAQEGSLRFNLFPDVDLLADVEERGEAPLGGTYLRGRLAGQPLSDWTLIEQEGTVSASIHAGDRYYQVSPLADGDYDIQEIDLAVLPPEADPMQPDLAPAPAAEPALPDISILADDGSTIDLLVVYTAQAAAGVGNINNLISTAVIETNGGYQNSQINPRVRVVHAAQVSYSESGFSWETTLTRLAGTTDGYLNDVHALRDQYAADAVVLLVNASGYCGIGYLMNNPSAGFASYAFTVVSTACATGYYSFGHELGHVMGATHDRNTTSQPGAYPYSFGYQEPGGAFRTIMAYNTLCPGFCPRINYWSNPDVSYAGRPTGVHYLAGNAADNRRTLNQTAAIVANFRTASVSWNPTNLQAAPSSGTRVNLIWNAVPVTTLVERTLSGSTSWQTIATLAPNTSFYSDINLTCNQTYSYRLRATSDDGWYSPYSNTASAKPDCPVCIPAATLNCSLSEAVTVAGSTAAAGATDLIDAYACPANQDVSGPEFTYQYTGNFFGRLTVTLNPGSRDSFDLFGLSSIHGSCDTDTCRAGGDAVTLPVTPNSSAYMVVDGPAAGGYTLTVRCEEFNNRVYLPMVTR